MVITGGLCDCDLDCAFQLDDWVISGVNSLWTFEDL